jgi:hypothetical protein
MTASSSNWPPASGVIEATRAFNHAAVAVLKVPSTLDSREAAERSAYFASMVIGPGSTAGQKLAALVERVVAGALNGEEVDRDVRSALSLARSVDDIRAVCETLDRYAAKLTEAGHYGVPALEALSPAREQFEAKFWAAELPACGFPNGFSPAELAVLESLHSDSPSGDHPMLTKPQISKTTGLATETVSATLQRLEDTGFVARAAPEKRVLPHFALNKRGLGALTFAMARPAHGMAVA